jgi:hypothetical protein
MSLNDGTGSEISLSRSRRATAAVMSTLRAMEKSGAVALDSAMRRETVCCSRVSSSTLTCPLTPASAFSPSFSASAFSAFAPSFFSALSPAFLSFFLPFLSFLAASASSFASASAPAPSPPAGSALPFSATPAFAPPFSAAA